MVFMCRHDTISCVSLNQLSNKFFKISFVVAALFLITSCSRSDEFADSYTPLNPALEAAGLPKIDSKFDDCAKSKEGVKSEDLNKFINTPSKARDYKIAKSLGDLYSKCTSTEKIASIFPADKEAMNECKKHITPEVSSKMAEASFLQDPVRSALAISSYLSCVQKETPPDSIEEAILIGFANTSFAGAVSQKEASCMAQSFDPKDHPDLQKVLLGDLFDKTIISKLATSLTNCVQKEALDSAVSVSSGASLGCVSSKTSDEPSLLLKIVEAYLLQDSKTGIEIYDGLVSDCATFKSDQQ